MLARHIYYELKPFLPRPLRYAIRRILARNIREKTKAIWPIDETAGSTPANWPGWPEKKRFAFVLSHDVEGPEGAAKCRQLANFEKDLGFKSSFNLIPEGSYPVDPELRKWLTQNDFEVGIHDLHHDGKLYRGKNSFSAKAARINQYIKEWGIDGFRSGFMLRNLDWLHQLDIKYDSSTFDTDPFEPQCDGSGTIFPYWIPAPLAGRVNDSNDSAMQGNPERLSGKGYYELPYTLPQDSTLFLVLKEQSPQIWLNKLDWVAQHGGMALVNVHPDYIQFDSSRPEPHTFPIKFYADLLRHVKEKYAGSYWHATPREVTQYLTKTAGISGKVAFRT